MVYKKAPAKSKSIEEIVGKPQPNGEVLPQAQDSAIAEKLQEEASVTPTPVIRKVVVGEPVVRRIDDLSAQTQEVSGILDIQHEGHGFLRPKFIPSGRDVYISQSQIRRFMLRPGDLIEGIGRPPKDTERYYGLLKVEKVNNVLADDSMKRPYFDDLTPIYPKKQIILASGKLPLSTRIIDLVAPIGFGQRGMIVSRPKAGKTTILKEIAAGISQNFPKAHLMAALIGERSVE